MLPTKVVPEAENTACAVAQGRIEGRDQGLPSFRA